MQLLLVSSVHLALAFGQFIAAPVPFDTANLFVVPTGTSVVTFGATTEVATSFPVAPAPEASDSPKPSATVSNPSLVLTPEASSSPAVSVSSSSDSKASSTVEVAPAHTTPSTIITSASTRAPETSHEQVVTVVNTEYTTVPCTTSTTPTTTTPPSTELQHVSANSRAIETSTDDQIALAPSINFFDKTTSPALSVPTGSHTCEAKDVASFNTTVVLQSLATEVVTSRITQTHVITVSV